MSNIDPSFFQTAEIQFDADKIASAADAQDTVAAAKERASEARKTQVEAKTPEARLAAYLIEDAAHLEIIQALTDDSRLEWEAGTLSDGQS